MKQQVDQDIPDFLHGSPYFPLYENNNDPPATSQTSEGLFQTLRLRRRGILTWILRLAVIFILLKTIRGLIVYRWFSGPRCLRSGIVTPNIARMRNEHTDWGRFAYAQYVTNEHYLCNSLMIFESLYEHGSKADRVMLYPSTFNVDSNEPSSLLLRAARDTYEVKLVPIEVVHHADAYYIWADSYTKLLAFNQTQYKRIVLLDSDATILKPMDELFFIPSVAAAMPRAYWMKEPQLGSHIMVIEPSKESFSRVEKAIQEARYGSYDMEIVNELFGDNCVLLPHRRYAMLTGEFRSGNHQPYLAGGEKGVKTWWDPEEERREAKLVHFSDFPLEKPWVTSNENDWEKSMPNCIDSNEGADDCRARDIWVDLYKDFRERRKTICGLDTI